MNSLNNISETAKELLERRIGYRNDGLSTGIYKIKDIIDFETFELGNEDIYDTCEEVWNTRDPLSVIHKFYGHIDVYGMWFGRREDILNNYAEDGETEVSRYSIPKKAIILSDLGEEGVLFAFEEHPDNLFLDSEIVQNTISLATKHS